MLALIVPVLVNFLLEPLELVGASSHRKLLHDVSLQKLMRIGPQYPQVSNIQNMLIILL